MNNLKKTLPKFKPLYLKRHHYKGPAQWLTPVIPATWEVEIGRIAIQGQSKS
jgi:hypothetical protein